jgi:hypothetical protein
MKHFKRTSNGLNNQHLFYDVDFIVFVEGGTKSFTKTEVYAGQYQPETDDIIFWRNIFTEFQKAKKIKFKSIGSKTTIKEIAVDIVNGQLKTVMVAMDNEFDEILNQRINHSNIFYTHGYSWENDIWNDKVIKAVIEELTAIKISHTEVEDSFNKFLKQIKIAVLADGYLFKKASSFFPRQSGYMFCVECAPKDLPFTKPIEINKKLKSKSLNKSTLYSFGKRNLIESQKFCYGHLLADFCCQLIIHYLKNRHQLSGMRKDIIYRMGINKFFQTSFIGSSIYKYHESQFKRNGA